ncbi:MAG TPA: CHAT domain-containing protein [Gemmatimonadales bacterium]|nr:CHAT domain-containing protein [Gemmatimonadales bacterium]
MTARRPRRTFGGRPTGRRTGEDLLLLPLWFLLQVPTTGTAPPGRPAAVLTWAERRAEAPAPSRAIDSLLRAIQARPADAGSRLALATLERLRGAAGAARGHLAPLARAEDPAWASAALSGLGHIEREWGSYIVADTLFLRAAEAASRAGDAALAAEAAIGRAATSFRRDGPGAALATLASAPAPPGDPRVVAQWHCERSFYSPYAGRAAESGADVAAGRRAAQAAGLRRRDALCQLALAHLLANSAAPEVWGALLDSAAATFRELQDVASIAFIRNFRGFQALLAYDHPKAHAELRLAAALADSAELPAQRAWARRHLGHLAWHLGDLPLAERELDAAIAALRAAGDEFGVVAAELARVGVLTELGRLEEARASYQHGWSYAVRTGMQVFGVWAQLGLASLDLRAGEGARAYATLVALQQGFAESGLTTVARGLEYDIGRAALLRGDLPEAERRFRRHLARDRDVSPLDRFSARSRLAEVLARRGELARAADELEAATDELEALRGSRTEPQLRLLAFQTKKGNDEPDLGFARMFHRLAAGGELERAWLLAERRRARELTDRIVLAGGTAAAGRVAAPLPEVRRALAARRAAMLAYVTGDGNQPTSAILVSAAGARVFELPPVSAGAGRFADLAEAAEGGEDGSLDSLAHEAARRLLPPALGALPAEVRTLVIVDDQGLHRVPFDLLRLPSGEAMVERFAVQHVPSATLLLALWARPARLGAGDILAFGDPFPSAGAETGPTADALYRGGETLGRLPGSAREARIVGGYARHSEVRVGRDATEAWLKRHPLERFRVIHVASHAVVGEEWASRTAIALAPGGGEDGFVTPAELAALPIAADLVVLSACRTARGMTVRGEGVLGLTAPLLAAGARAVIATGWDAPDEGMVRLSERLYDELAAGVPAGEAVRRAKLAARAAGRPAREWAAFRLMGDPFVVLPLRHPPPARWPLAAALLVLVAAYGVTVSRRGRDLMARPSENSARTIHT